eukprot:COSAG02_NODE_54_length_43941_cov_54.857990_19_plen_367_part_00
MVVPASKPEAFDLLESGPTACPNGSLHQGDTRTLACWLHQAATVALERRHMVTALMGAAFALTLAGGTGVYAGSFTTTEYDGPGCVDGQQSTSRGGQSTVEWTSGECAACPDNCPGAFGDAEFLQALAAGNPAVAPAYMKVTCAAGVATTEHFSDAACTAANKISAEDIEAAVVNLVAPVIVEEFDETGMTGMADCVTVSATGFAGVSVTSAQPVCGGVAVTTDRVRRCNATSAASHLRVLHGQSNRMSGHRYAPASQLSGGGWRAACLEKKPQVGLTQLLLSKERLSRIAVHCSKSAAAQHPREFRHLHHLHDLGRLPLGPGPSYRRPPPHLHRHHTPRKPHHPRQQIPHPRRKPHHPHRRPLTL